MKVALVHDWLLNIGGAERVLKELHTVYPDAPIYTLFYDTKFAKKFLPNAEIRASKLQNYWWIRHWYPYAAPLMPSTIEALDLSEFDTVISSSVFFSKGLILRPRTRHICYCHSPTRSLWDRNGDYQRQGFLARSTRHILRLWDRQAADRVDQFVANSRTVQERIKKYYRRTSVVLYPPVSFSPSLQGDIEIQKPYYLIVSRLFSSKNIDIAIEAFNKLKYPLVVIGDGPLRKKLQRSAGSNIRFLGHQPDSVVATYYQHCKALIMPQEEDFGITAIEAMHAGKPVVALARGGALETVVEGITGELFDDPNAAALSDGILRLNKNYASYDTKIIQTHAAQFSSEHFCEQIKNLVEQTTNEHAFTDNRQLQSA